MTVSNPGASAEEIETEITKRIEDAINTISGIDTIDLHLGRGISSVVIYVLSRQERRRRSAGSARQGQPGDPGPAGNRQDAGDAEIRPRCARRFCRWWFPRRARCGKLPKSPTNRSSRALENINGVGEIQLVGGLKREIRVWVDPDKMRAYNLSVADVANALKAAKRGAARRKRERGRNGMLSVRTLGRLVDPAQFDEIAIATRGPYVVKLRDIGHAEDSEEEPTTAARLNGDAVGDSGGLQAIRREHRGHRRRA